MKEGRRCPASPVNSSLPTNRWRRMVFEVLNPNETQELSILRLVSTYNTIKHQNSVCEKHWCFS